MPCLDAVLPPGGSSFVCVVPDVSATVMLDFSTTCTYCVPYGFAATIFLQEEPCIRSEQSTIEEYHLLSAMAAERSSDLLDYAMR